MLYIHIYTHTMEDIETMVLRYTLCKVSNKNFNKSCALFIKDNTKTVKEQFDYSQIKLHFQTGKR